MPIAKSLLLCFVAIVVVAAFTGCASSARPDKRPAARPSQPPRNADTQLPETGLASFYAHQYHGRKTASGERYNMNKLTAAHRTLPFGAKVRVTNLENNRAVMVRINDRGPFVRGRIIDVSLAAAKRLDLTKKGTARVRIESNR